VPATLGQKTGTYNRRATTMAKKEYPEVRHMEARIEAIKEGLSDAAFVLENIKDHALSEMPEKLRDTFAPKIEKSLASVELARRAIWGQDETRDK
jgi:hypothetical protein